LLTNTEQQAKRAKFERHFGKIDLGTATDLDKLDYSDKSINMIKGLTP
jgi:hypothetical protein